MIVAIDIGGTKLAVGVARAETILRTGTLDRLVKEPVAAPGTPESVIPRVLAIARELIGGGDDRAVASAGISIGGPLDHTRGVVVNFPHLPGWRDVPLCSLIARELDAPARLDNDANLGALAEHRFGAGRGCQDMVYVTVSTGIGGGVIVGGRLLHGVGSSAGEIGHLTVATDGELCACGNVGCMEAMASGTAIARRARQAVLRDPRAGSALRECGGGNPDELTALHVCDAARKGNPLALQIWRQTAEYLAVGLGGVIHVLAPQRIVIGGGVAQAGEFLLSEVRLALSRHVSYVPLDRIGVVGAELGHDSAVTGAGVLAAERSLKSEGGYGFIG